MVENFVTLKCQSCGGRLDIYPDTDRFACGYCGTELLVQRRGGTVALTAATEAIQKIQISTDKTAAELAIARYEKELNEVRSQAQILDSQDSHSIGKLVGAGAIALTVGLIVGFANNVNLGAIFGAAGIVLIVVAYKRAGVSPELERQRNKIRQLENLIEEKKRIADS